MNVRVKLFAAGGCRSLEALMIKGGRFLSVHCPAICALIIHPVHGYLLFDTGYSFRVFEEARKFPMNLYPIVTPIEFREEESAKDRLKSWGILPEEVKTIILSHFHIDHMGGAKDFPAANFIFSKQAFQSTRHLKGMRALFGAYMAGLEPCHFAERANMLDRPNVSLTYPGFEEGYDLLGDGSLIAVRLPGHAAGQIGLFVQAESQTLLLAADACWTSRIYRECLLPHPLTKCIINDYAAFALTLEKLHRLHLLRPDIKIIPSHCQENL